MASPSTIWWGAATSGGNMRWAAERRPRGSLLPQGGLSSQDAPPISLLVLPKEKRAVHGPKRKSASAGRSGAAQPSCAHGGRRIGAAPISCLGHARPSRGRKLPALGGWCRGAGDVQAHTPCFSFRCRSLLPRRTSERAASGDVANERLIHCDLHPDGLAGHPQGSARWGIRKDLSVPEGRKWSSANHPPPAAGGLRLRRPDPPNIFSFPPGAAHFLFDVSKRKWGAHPAWTMPPGGSLAPRPPSGGPPISPGGGNLPIPPRNTESAPAHTLSRGDLG